ncbi:MAG: MFS transporter [Vitreoscilla sp.]|nr:MFS transporter [Vitreoscilla sp.]
MTPLFPLFIRDFGLSYSELGLLVSVFFIISGVGQALAGFVVDRFGARPVLMLAMCSFAAAGLASALATSYPGLMLAAALAGLGNAPFHPADFTILNKRVSANRLGHAFSVHGITGNLGWAAAPVFLTGITAWSGNWRLAEAAAGAWALVVLGLLWWHREAINDRADTSVSPRAAAQPAVAVEHPMAFLRLPSVWLCFSFFFWTTCALSAIQGFASPALHELYGLTLEWTSFIVTGFMLCGAVGMVLGGFLVGRTERLEKLIAACLLGSAAVLALVGTGLLPAAAALVVASMAGFGTGLAGPSRDMLIKRAAPPGATGRVYGTVYSGLDIGFALAAPLFGALMDHHRPGAVFYGSALALLAGVVSASLVGANVARRRAQANAAVA